MPAFWKAISIEDRHVCMSKIDGFHACAAAEPGTTPWSKANFRELTKYCSLDHLVMLRAAYLMAKCDGSVFVERATMTTTVAATETTTATATQPIKKFLDIKKTYLTDSIKK